MIPTSINNQLILFLFLNTLDLEYSKKILKDVYLKLHSKNEKLNEADVLKNSLKKILAKNYITTEVSLGDFTNSCQLVFEDHNSINFHLWFLFFKRSIKSERETFILSQILKINENEIMSIQNQTAGTVRSRISSCYNKFTEVIQNG